MRSGAIPFQFEIAAVVNRLAATARGQSSDIQLSLPALTVFVRPSVTEKAAAMRILTRAADRRVLSAQECCDTCIDEALNSLQELRAELVREKVNLSSEPDGSLFQLIELLLVAIRQFLTFEQRLSKASEDKNHDVRSRPPNVREAYFDALELLRGHLNRCLAQVAHFANTPSQNWAPPAAYSGPWQMEAYKPFSVRITY